MITAKQVLTRLQEKANKCEWLDNWIDTELIRLFSLTEIGAPVRINFEYISHQKWPHHRFVLEMQDRGFVVDFKPSEGVASKGKYEITIPMPEGNHP